MSRLKDLLGKLFKRDRRRADRLLTPELAAYFWTGAAPVEHFIRDVSTTGLFLITEERWFPGTIVMVTLQKKDSPEDDAGRTIAVRTKIVRWGEDGVGLAFVVSPANDRRRGEKQLKDGADRRSLNQFLKGFHPEDGSAVVHRVLPSADKS